MFEPFLILSDAGWTLLPIILLALVGLVLSSYVKIVTVLSIVRIGLGMNSLASVFVTGGLALALSFFVMYPTLDASSSAIDRRLKQDNASANAQLGALEAGVEEWRKFVARYADDEEKERFAEIAVELDRAHSGASSAKGAESSREHSENENSDRGTNSADQSNLLENSWRVLAPAFLVSELKAAFATGLSLFLPFLLIDIIVAAATVSVGFTAVDPRIIAFPFKLLLFVVVDGWLLITSNLVMAYAQ